MIRFLLVNKTMVLQSICASFHVCSRKERQEMVAPAFVPYHNNIKPFMLQRRLSLWNMIPEGGVYWQFLRFGRFCDSDLLYKLHCLAVICANVAVVFWECIFAYRKTNELSETKEDLYTIYSDSNKELTLVFNANCLTDFDLTCAS